MTSVQPIRHEGSDAGNGNENNDYEARTYSETGQLAN